MDDMTRKRLDHMGVELVRMRLENGSFGIMQRDEIIEWLAEKDQASKLLSEASQAEQMEIARSAKDAAWDSAASARDSATEARASNTIARKAHKSAINANRIAILSAAIALFSTILSVIAILANHSK